MSHVHNRTQDFLTSGGEMGALMRGVDWASSPLGPVEQWPQSLRTSLSILLDTYFPMYIAWGRDFIQFYNDGYRPILGLTKHPGALGRAARETFAESWHIIGPMFEGVMQGNTVGSEDWMLPLDRYGYLEECYFTYSYSPIRDESGDVGGVLVTVSETTQRVLSERRLRTLRDLAFQTEQNVSIEDIAHTAIEILSANPADMPLALFYSVHGEQALLLNTTALPTHIAVADIAPSSVDLNQPDAWLLDKVVQLGNTQVVDDVEERFGSFAIGLWPEPIAKAVVLPISRPGQSEPYGVLVIGISPRREFDDDYRSFLTLVVGQVATAISNGRAYAEERKRAEGLVELDRAKTEFFSNVSHEFRTPLTLMINPLQDLLNGVTGSLTPQQAETLDIAYRNSLRLLKLVNTLLNFSRIQNNRIEAAFEPTDLATFTAGLCSIFRSAIEQAGMQLVVDCPPLPEPSFVDREMWEKIVLNLLSNAYKFTFEGKIAVTLRALPEQVELTIQDTGIGIAAAELPHLFERFFRVQGVRTRTHEGSGIGLALVKELVNLHGGHIDVVSTPGTGTTFTVTIPRGTAHLPQEQIRTGGRIAPGVEAVAYVEEALRWLPDDPIMTEQVTEQVLYTNGIDRPIFASDVSHACILIVDDNRDMRDYLRRLLNPHYQVKVADNGQSALTLIAEQLPDLVLTDVMMPSLDGVQLLQELRADLKTRTLPIILLSARAGEEARIEGLNAGADDYIVKPFSARELIARIDAHLNIAQLRQQLLDTERDSRHKAEESDRLKLQFLAMVSHELRTPLSAIKGFSSTLLATDIDWDVENQRAFISIIDQEADKLTTLIEEVLDLSRLQAGRLEIKPQPQSLAHIIESVQAELAVMTKEHCITTDVPFTLPLVFADSMRIAQVITNLVGNAAKYTPVGTLIQIIAKPINGYVQVDVSDEGDGISPAMREVVFEAFRQGEGQKQGAGLGLAICKGLVEAHNGKIWIGENATGTVISFTLPIVEVV
ncbi:MAG: ATP-binding protein [Chloroflexota bacterium]